MRGLRVLGVALISLVVTGCAIGNRYAYHTIIADPRVAGTTAIGVATHDQREYVRSGSKDPQFVGLQRGGFGNPFDVRTEDDKPLADGMTTAIVNTLNRKGFRSQSVVVAHSVSPDEARQRLLRAGTDRALLLTVKEWKSDAVMRIGLTYDVTMTVLDRAGQVLAEKRLGGDKEVLGAAGLPSAVGEVVGKAFKAKLEALLDDPAIAGTLRGGS
jgi:hypothetical protein